MSEALTHHLHLLDLDRQLLYAAMAIPASLATGRPVSLQ